MLNLKYVISEMDLKDLCTQHLNYELNNNSKRKFCYCRFPRQININNNQ